jgi:hypothetical protein
MQGATFDVFANHLVLVGGYDAVQNLYYNDVWFFTPGNPGNISTAITSSMWSQIGTTVVTGGTFPGRTGHVMGVRLDEVYIYSGYGLVGGQRTCKLF